MRHKGSHSMVGRLTTLYKIRQGLVEIDTADFVQVPQRSTVPISTSCNCVSLQ